MENNRNPSCGYGTSEYLLSAYSGASDAGYISDQVSRKLVRNKVRKISYFSFVGTRNQQKIGEFSKADLLVMDGCCGCLALNSSISGLRTSGYHLRSSTFPFCLFQTKSD